MKEQEFSGKTIEEAKHAALEQLGLSEDQVEFTVIKKGRTGILGMGSGEAKILVKTREQSQEITPESSIEAIKVLESLIELLGLDAKVKVLSGNNEGPVTLNLEGEDLGVLIGRRGQTLASLQYLVRLIVSEKTKNWVSINVDVAGYKKKRYESLEKLALRLADHVKITKRSMNLEPMPPDERRVIHLTLSNHPDVSTHSIDEGERRKVVIQFRKH